MDYITISIFDIFKIGPGPSSSHTIGPMRAALNFRKAVEKLNIEVTSSLFIDVHLYGSLSATGKGHGTDRAILAGLMGSDPQNCNTELLKSYFEHGDERYCIDMDGKKILFDYDSFHFEEIHHLFPYCNTIILQLKSKDRILLEKEYYSIGGGFVITKGEIEAKNPVLAYPYSNMAQLKEQLFDNNLNLKDLMIANEMALTQKSKEEIREALLQIIETMEQAVNRGISTSGFLPGPLKLERRAKTVYEMALRSTEPSEKFLLLLDAYALAASEENAAGHMVVTAPTSGACGVIPAIVMLLKHYFCYDLDKISEGLLAAAACAFIAKHNASISGAEVGCQGEIGVASAMGAALLSYVKGASIDVIENAAEIALEHLLGLTCDPVMGYVQIPCIERNALAASGAYNAYCLASSSTWKRKISFDQVVNVMLQTGKDMCLKYKETSKGGLALCKINAQD